MTLKLIRTTDEEVVKTAKQNATITQVNEFNGTAQDIAAFATAAQAAANAAAAARDEARELSDGVAEDAGDAEEAREAADAARIAAETARSVAVSAASTATTKATEAGDARDEAVDAKDAALLHKAAAYASEQAALLSAGQAVEAAEDAIDAKEAAEAAENSLLEWKGAWATATAYELGDIVNNSGSSYVCVEAHTSGTFSTDLGADKWEVFAQKGAAGEGSGDMLADTYDPQNKAADAFDRANHTGAQSISTITGLTDALAGKAASSHSHSDATTEASGFMSAADKAAVNTIPKLLRVDASQAFSTEEKAKGRENLGLGTLATLSPGGTPTGAKFLRDDGQYARDDFILHGSGPLTGSAVEITGLGIYRDLMITLVKSTASHANRRALRVGSPSGFLSTAIYHALSASYDLAHLTTAAAAARTASIIIYNFNTTDPVKPAASPGYISDIPLVCIETPLALDRIRLFNAVGNLNGGTYYIFGRK